MPHRTPILPSFDNLNSSALSESELQKLIPSLPVSWVAGEKLHNVFSNQYYGSVKLGSDKESLNVVFDTGSADLWFPEKAIKSTTLVRTSRPAHVQYAKGQVSGIIALDTLYLPGLKPLEKQAFILIKKMAQMALAADGILGLAFPGLSSGQVTVESNLETMGVSGFSFYLTGEQTGSALAFSTEFPSEWVTNGPVTYFPVTLGAEYWWSVTGSVEIGDEMRFDGMTAIFDTGSSFILIPERDFGMAVTHILGPIKKDCVWMMPTMNVVCSCDRIKSARSMKFGFQSDKLSGRFGSTVFTFMPEQLFRPLPQQLNMCLLEVGMVGDAFPWILGDTFLRQMAISFDIQKKRVGLASRATPDYVSTYFLVQRYEDGFCHLGMLAVLLSAFFLVVKGDCFRSAPQQAPLLG